MTGSATEGDRVQRFATRQGARSTGSGTYSLRGAAGTATVELVLLAPVLLTVLCLLVGLGRAADARGRLTGAVRDGARAASLAAAPGAAARAADATVRADLVGAGLECRGPQVGTDISAWRPGGSVTVTIRCQLDLSALLLSGLPGRRTLTAAATVPLDTYTGYTAPDGGLR